MKKIKKIILFSIFILGLAFLFAPTEFPQNFKFEEILKSSQEEVIIIFNSGGWGNTSPEQAKDFEPIIKGIQGTLNEWDLDSAVVTYERTKDNFLGKVTTINEMRRSFQNQAEILAKTVDNYLRQNPSKKIIMAGLSNGASFVDSTMEKISEDLKDSVFSIEAGIPFWERPLDSQNVLWLDNQGKDPLAKGEMKILISTILKAPFKWALARISNKNLTFTQAIHVPGHDYDWNELAPEINSFLENKFANL